MDQDKAQARRRVTAALLGACTVLLLVWDVVVAYNDTPDDTISELVRDLSHGFYSLPFIVMVVMGHFFWNQDSDDRAPLEERRKTFWLYVALPSALLIGRDLLNLVAPLPHVDHANLGMAIAGFGVGAKFWPQEKVPPSA